MSIEQRYTAFEKAKNYTKQYELDKIDSIVTKQEDDMLGYISAGQFATTGSNIFTDGQIILGNQTIIGDLNVNGNINVSTLVSASVIYESGSTIFGNSSDDTHQMTGSVSVTGSLNVNGQPVVLGPLGWARYDDTQYTTSSVFTLTPASGEQILPNNGGNTIETHLHSTVSFYNTGSQTIQVENSGDVYMCTVVFDAKTSNANAAYLRLQLDSNGSTPYERVGKDLFFGKGNDVWHEYHEVFQWYADDDFVENGNVWRVQSFGANVNIANIIYFIQRTQNHLI